MIRETIPLWLRDEKLPSFPKLETCIKCDVCIVGAGIAGLTTAYQLSKRGRKVIVVDDGEVAGGQSMRTTGHLTCVLRERFHTLESYFGKENTKLAIDAHISAINFIHTLATKYAIDCDWETTKAYLFFGKAQEKLLNKEFEAALRLNLSAKILKRAPIESFDSGPAISFDHQGRIHPIKYLKALCQLILAQGGAIYGNTHVSSINKRHNYHLKTSQKQEIHADHVVVATNSPINSRFFPHLKQAPYRTYVIAGVIPKEHVSTGLFYDTLDPYHYIRFHQIDGQDILIIGGEDHRTGEEKDIDKRYSQLESWARDRFPWLGIVFRWSGQVTESVDGLGFIGRVHDDQELYIITGDSGNGLTNGTLGASLVSDLIMTTSSPYEQIFSPYRKTLKAAPTFIKENFNTAFQYRDWITCGDKDKEVSERASGVVVRKGLKKCAIFHDEKGETHEMSAICPHLGAIIRWNESEKCWECPAHGSRFKATGEVIQGPSNQDLKKL